MEEGKIPDEAITASSSYEMKSVGPQNARYKKIISTIHAHIHTHMYDLNHSCNNSRILVEYDKRRTAVPGARKLRSVVQYANTWRLI